MFTLRSCCCCVWFWFCYPFTFGSCLRSGYYYPQFDSLLPYPPFLYLPTLLPAVGSPVHLLHAFFTHPLRYLITFFDWFDSFVYCLWFLPRLPSWFITLPGYSCYVCPRLVYRYYYLRWIWFDSVLPLLQFIILVGYSPLRYHVWLPYPHPLLRLFYSFTWLLHLVRSSLVLTVLYFSLLFWFVTFLRSVYDSLVLTTFLPALPFYWCVRWFRSRSLPPFYPVTVLPLLVPFLLTGWLVLWCTLPTRSHCDLRSLLLRSLLPFVLYVYCCCIAVYCHFTPRSVGLVGSLVVGSLYVCCCTLRLLPRSFYRAVYVLV